MELFVKAEVPSDLSGATLIMPAVAHANVGELAVDVLITTLRPQRVGMLDDPNILPAVGNDAYDLSAPGTLATALELFQLAGTNTFLLQQRAPAITGRQAAFAANLAAWLRSVGVARLLLLCGLDAQMQQGMQLDAPGTRFVASSATDAAALAACRSLSLQPLEQNLLEEERSLHSLLPPWPLLQLLQPHTALNETASPSASAPHSGGTGAASSSQQVQDAAGAGRAAAATGSSIDPVAAAAVPLSHLLLARFASEGDNVHEGLRLAADTLRLLQQLQLLQPMDAAGGSNGRVGAQGLPELRTPCSWAGVYGKATPKELL